MSKFQDGWAATHFPPLRVSTPETTLNGRVA